MEPLIGQITIFAGNFAPRGWALCDGQLLPISANSALFSVLGTTYGGDGRSTFALPDLRGRAPVHVNSRNADGIDAVGLGQKFGENRTAMSTPQHDNPSFFGVNYIIALQGQFPSRS